MINCCCTALGALVAPPLPAEKTTKTLKDETDERQAR
jgi:hypothetical protein